MSRHQSETHLWSFDPLDEGAVPNARIALALMLCVRRLPGAYPGHDFDDLGALLGPVVEQHSALARRLVVAHLKARLAVGEDIRMPETLGPSMLQERDVQSLIGEAFARSFPRFRHLFAKVQTSLQVFLTRHSFAADRNIEMLVRLVELPPPEEALVRLAAAFCYSPIKRSHFAFVDSPARIVNAVEQLCSVRGNATLRLFAGNGVLARSCLFEALNNRRQRVDLEDLLKLSAAGECLLGTPFHSEAQMAAAVLAPLQPPTATCPLQWPHLALQATLVRSALVTALDTARPGVNLMLYGAPGTGKTEFVRQLVADIGATGFVVGSTDGEGAEASRGERLASLQLCQTFAGREARTVLVLDEAEDIFLNDYHDPSARLFGRPTGSKAWVNGMLETNPHPVVWISNRISQLDPAYLRRFSYCLEFPQTPHAVRRRIAQERLGPIGCSDGLIDAVAAIAQVTPAQLDAAATFADLTLKGGLGVDAAVTSAVEAQLKAGGHSSTVQTSTRPTRFDMRYLSVRGHASPEQVLASLGRMSTDGGSGGATLLFSGPSGTGKTQFAGEIAARLSRQLVVRTASDINSKWHGESEGNVARMFRDCDPRGELLFLDEAEILLGAREASGHRAERAVTAEFLRWLEAFEGIFVCATNHAGSFDAALMRRFTFRLEFEPLRLDQRLDLYAELALGWSFQSAEAGDAAAAPALAPVDATTRAGLTRLDQLTPGDFANAARRIRALGLPASVWIDELTAEQAAKRAGGSPRIGFM